MFIRLPNKIRQADERIEIVEDIEPMEILIGLMALSRYNGINSLVTMNTLQLDYNISEGQFKSKPNSPKLVDYLHSADDKGIIQWINREDYKDRNSPILVDMAAREENYISLDYNQVNRVLKSNLRMDVKAITVYAYAILVGKAGFRDFEKDDYSNPNRQKGYCFPSHYRLSNHINSSIEGVKSALQNLEDLNLIEIVNNGYYETRDKQGNRVVRQLPNSYVIKQKDWQIIKKEALKDISLLESKAHNDKIKSLMITKYTEDGYNTMEEVFEYEGEVDSYIDTMLNYDISDIDYIEDDKSMNLDDDIARDEDGNPMLF